MGHRYRGKVHDVEDKKREIDDLDYEFAKRADQVGLETVTPILDLAGMGIGSLAKAGISSTIKLGSKKGVSIGANSTKGTTIVGREGVGSNSGRLVADGPFSYLPGNKVDGIDYVGPYTRFDTTSTTTVYRVDDNAFAPRISSDGSIPAITTKKGNERALFVNFGQPERAKEFALINRNGNATITAVDVNTSLLDRLRATSVHDLTGAKTNTSAPLQVDIKAADQYGLRSTEQINLLRNALDPSTVRIIDPKDL